MVISAECRANLKQVSTSTLVSSKTSCSLRPKALLTHLAWSMLKVSCSLEGQLVCGRVFANHQCYKVWETSNFPYCTVGLFTAF